MAHGRVLDPCLGPNVKFFCKRFLYVMLFLFFQISARSSLKKFENEKWPKAGSSTAALDQMLNFFGSAFYMSYVIFFFSQISARSNLTKFENEKWPKAVSSTPALGQMLNFFGSAFYMSYIIYIFPNFCK